MDNLAAAVPVATTGADAYSALLRELRGPVSSIQSYVRTLMSRDATLSPVARATMYQVVLQQSARLDSFVDDILLYVQLVERAVPIAAEPVLVASIVEDLRHRLGEPERVVVGPGSDRIVTADRIALAHALRRLLRNALVYGARRQQVTVGTLEDDDAVTIWVADSGLGIPEQARDRAQEPFARAVRAGERRHDGIGLGLTVARELAQLMSGELVLSDNNPGLRAGIRLPR